MKSDFFSIKFLEALPNDQLDALDLLCEEFSKFEQVAGLNEQFHEDCRPKLVNFFYLTQKSVMSKSKSQWDFGKLFPTENSGRRQIDGADQAAMDS